MVDNLSSFVNWLNSLMAQKGLSQADIARTKIVTSSAVSLLFSLRIKSVGVDMCKAIAVAADIPLETVYRKAGLLPPLKMTEAEMEEIAALTAQLDPDLRQNAIDYIQHLTAKQRTRQTIKAKKNAI
jgi:transcriptional regulator with XRE-family HTH domain